MMSSFTVQIGNGMRRPWLYDFVAVALSDRRKALCAWEGDVSVLPLYGYPHA
jgi:hypothetical protein